MLKINSRTIRPRNIVKTIRAMSGSPIVAKFSQTSETRTNWGDALNPVLIGDLSGRDVINVNDLIYYNDDVISVIGSVLDNNSVANLVVWGSGFKSFKPQMRVLPKQVLALRGPLTRKELHTLGVSSPERYGDPAILYRSIYQPKKDKQFRLGIIPHYAEKSSALITRFNGISDSLIIDIQDDLNKVVDDVVSCDAIISSSLHGLIIADTYGVPSAWIKVEDKLYGDDFKFLDYYASLGVKEAHPQQLTATSQLGDIAAWVSHYDVSALYDQLLKSNPFKK